VTAPVAPAELYREPNALASSYSGFAVDRRLLLTGHSHQAWPDCSFVGQRQAWLDAATLVDDKWDAAFAQADRVREGFRRLLVDPPTVADIALGTNTHELLVRFLSSLPLRARPRIVTTDGEFHTMRRQLDRLAEEGLELVAVASTPVDSIADRLAAAIDDHTAAVLASAVLYQTAEIVPGLARVADAAARRGVPLLVDAYHALNVVPFALAEWGLEAAHIIGGGYKYCQLGEGNCFLRVPADGPVRPVITGWYAEFGALADGDHPSRVAYASGAGRWAGATYDPTSHYRAACVFDFFQDRGMDAGLLREVSLHQVGRLAERFDALDADPALVTRDRTLAPEARGGFLALGSPSAGRLQSLLKARGVSTDARGEVLRFGPAPYLSDRQLDDAMAALGECIRAVAR